MGAVYEALLSYRGFIAEEDLYEVKRAGDSFNELDVGYFVTAQELDQYTEEERVRYESGDKKGLSDHFKIDSISEASDLLFLAKKDRQIIALRKYYENQSMTNLDFRSYEKEHNLEERLANDKHLLEISPEKMKSILDKD